MKPINLLLLLILAPGIFALPSCSTVTTYPDGTRVATAPATEVISDVIGLVRDVVNPQPPPVAVEVEEGK